MAILYYNNPKVTDQIEFDFYTPDADGCFFADPYAVENIKVYFVERNLNGVKNTLNLVDQFDVVKQKEYLDAQQLACDYPTETNIANAFKLKKQFESTSIFNSTWYTQANVIFNVGNATSPIWTAAGPNTDSIISKITGESGSIQNGHFKFVWSPNGTIREGDFYLCWTWAPNLAGDRFSNYLHFYVNSNISNEVTSPAHVIDPSKYKNILDSYLPEMYKMSYANNDLTVPTLDRLNYSIGDGFTVLDNLGIQLVDITDANATQEPILGHLASFFGMPLRSSDVTLWRRQIKTAIPLCKKKGTLEGLREALSNAGIGLLNYSQLWQCRTSAVFTETFEFTGSYSFILSNVSLDPTNPTYTPFFSLEKRNPFDTVDTSYQTESLSNITISTSGGVSTMEWTGAELEYNYSIEVGEVIKITYLLYLPTGGDLTKYNIIKDLPLADLRDDRNFKYPPKDWNTKVISEDNSDFSTVVTQKNPFVDYLYFGKVRTKFPYSENVYNMDEYNGSLRDSQRPCDIDKNFIEPCSNGISAKFSLDVEISNLSDDRITECQSITNEFTPMHSILHTLNFTGKFEDIILPPIEQYEALVQYNQEEYCIAGMAQYVFNRAMYLGLNQNAVYRNELTTQWTWNIIEGTQAFNQAITLFCSDVNFQTLGVRNIDTETLLEVLSPSPNSGEYHVQSPNSSYIDVSQTIPVNESPSLNKSTFTFRLSNINLADSNFTATQSNMYKLSDTTVTLSDYAIKTVWDVNNGYAAQAWQVTLPTGTYDILDMHDDVLIIDNNGTLSNTSATGVTWSLISPTATELTSNYGDYVVEIYGKITLDPSLNYNNVNSLIDGNGYFYLDSSSDQFKFYSYVDGDNQSFLVYDWNGGTGTVAGKILKRLVDGKTGNFGYRGMMIRALPGWPVFDNPASAVVDNNNFIWNYLVAQYFVAVPKLYAITEVMTIGPDNYWVLDGALIDYGVAAGTPTTFQIFRYSKESIQLFGEQLYDVSRLGQEIYDYAVDYSFSMMERKSRLAMKQEEPAVKDNITPQEFINIKIEYADGRIETGEI